ncbi:MAG: Uma2 family endonuclease [Dehalococcoidia bacterium]
MSLPVIGGRVTPEELLEMEGAYELLEGKLVERWASRSSMLTSLNVARIVSGFLERFPIGELYGSGLGIRVFRDRDRVRKASLSFVRTSRIPAGDFGFLEVPPDLVIEVLSPSNRGGEMRLKIQEWLDNGVAEAWLLYPLSREIYVYRNDAPTRVLTASDPIESPSILPGFMATVADLFPATLPAPAIP